MKIRTVEHPYRLDCCTIKDLYLAAHTPSDALILTEAMLAEKYSILDK